MRHRHTDASATDRLNHVWRGVFSHIAMARCHIQRTYLDRDSLPFGQARFPLQFNGSACESHPGLLP